MGSFFLLLEINFRKTAAAAASNCSFLSSEFFLLSVLLFEDCGDVQRFMPNFTSGVYTINPPGLPATAVWCDRDVDDGLAWTVSQFLQVDRETKVIFKLKLSHFVFRSYKEGSTAP